VKLENKSIKQLRDTADKIFNKYVVLRDGQCMYGKIYGGCSGVLQCSHVVAKGTCSSLRYDEKNAKCLCLKHHIWGWHLRDVEQAKKYVDWFVEYYPERWEYVQEKKAEYKRDRTFRITKDYYIDIIKKYKAKIKELDVK